MTCVPAQPTRSCQPARDLGQATGRGRRVRRGIGDEARKDASAASTALERQQNAHQQAWPGSRPARTPPRPGTREARPATRNPFPLLARQLLPADPLAATPGHLTAARESGQRPASSASQSSARPATTQPRRSRKSARHSTSATRGAAAKSRSPLQELTAELARWGEAIEQAAAAAGDGAAPLPGQPCGHHRRRCQRLRHGDSPKRQPACGTA